MMYHYNQKKQSIFSCSRAKENIYYRLFLYYLWSHLQQGAGREESTGISAWMEVHRLVVLLKDLQLLLSQGLKAEHEVHVLLAMHQLHLLPPGWPGLCGKGDAENEGREGGKRKDRQEELHNSFVVFCLTHLLILFLQFEYIQFYIYLFLN